MRGHVLAWAHHHNIAPSRTDGNVNNKAHRPSTDGFQRLEWSCGQHNHVHRGVWFAELHNQRDMADMSLIMLGFLEEVLARPSSADSLKALKEQGGYHMPLRIFTNRCSTSGYLRTQRLKFPAENGHRFPLCLFV